MNPEADHRVDGAAAAQNVMTEMTEMTEKKTETEMSTRLAREREWARLGEN